MSGICAFFGHRVLTDDPGEIEARLREAVEEATAHAGVLSGGGLWRRRRKSAGHSCPGWIDKKPHSC